MLNPKKIITDINRVSKSYFPESSFYLEPKSFYKYYSTGDYTSKAINHNKNSSEEINVVKWFDEFWIFIEISFNQSDKKTVNTFFSLSVFEGSSHEKSKIQLFRAEWDTYNNNLFHPQPHWHFYSHDGIENLVKDFADVINTEQSDFIQLVNKDKSKGIEINKMHFAMSALWNQEIDGHIQSISKDSDLINWYQGLLSHIKTQLEFAK